MVSKVQIKTIRALQHKKYRQKSGRFVAEGIKIINELLKNSKIRVETLYILPSCLENEIATAGFGGQIVKVTEQELKKISFLTNPQGAVALCRIPESIPLPTLAGQITLMLDSIRDPGNLGTIIRIADWFRIPLIACSSDCVDAYNPKVVQATMGSLTRVKIWSGQLQELLQKNAAIPVYATTLDGKSVTQIEKITEGVLLIGNESNGLSDALLHGATEKITIPRLGGAESLNAAIATGIICSHLLL